ncbi:MAG TPA: hypothetical protein VM888_08470 [Chitinophagaceae bacterium]|nr:hypothetical protein [Chitinophagaceae bacterium]
MKNCSLLLILFAFASCSNNNTTSKIINDDSTGSTVHGNSKDTIVTAQPLVLSGCYQMVFKKDSADLLLDVKDTTVTGTLNFYLFEKDKNTGSIKGVLRDNMIYADYTFQSEGKTSVREVVFKIEDQNLVQAFGDITEKGSKLVFTDKENLQYQTANPFIKTDCPK